MARMTQADWFVQHLAGFYQEKAGWFDPADIVLLACDAAFVASDAQKRLLVQLEGRGHATCGGALQANFEAVKAGVDRWELGCERFERALELLKTRDMPTHVPDVTDEGRDQMEGYLNLILGKKSRKT